MINLRCNVNVDFSGEAFRLVNFFYYLQPMHSCCLVLLFFVHVSSVSGRSSAYGDTTVEGHPAGPGSVSSSTGAISTTTAQQEGEGSEGEGETEGDIHTSNRSDRIYTLAGWIKGIGRVSVIQIRFALRMNRPMRCWNNLMCILVCCFIC